MLELEKYETFLVLFQDVTMQPLKELSSITKITCKSIIKLLNALKNYFLAVYVLFCLFENLKS